ncbi:MAG: rRNA-processing protein sof1 [Chrysothrix sp. TS-e1954]|nr:MAG: rRNA-processing protein sof1 [Chrysothrix sp. TS-e1954]
MKIKTLAHPQQGPGTGATPIKRNLDHHPFERAREYTRALNATKLERHFSKPFLGQLGRGHADGVYQLAKDPEALDRLASGSGDGVVKVWDLTSQEEVWAYNAHQSMVKGLCWTRNQKLLSCGAIDKQIHLFDPYSSSQTKAPLTTYHGKQSFTSLSHHRNTPAFAASTSSGIAIYDLEKSTSAPVQSLNWPSSVDTVNTVAFNQVETSILASTATDRSIVLYDLRTSSPPAKTVLHLAANSVAWNPMEGMNFCAASEDHNIYIFDARNMKRALNVCKDHVAAVMDVQFSPTGEELVSGSYDKTIRIWSRASGHSRDIYHTKRQQRVWAVDWSPDNAYVLAGSDDGNIRLWRANAASRQGMKTARQRQALEYQGMGRTLMILPATTLTFTDALKKRYAHMPEIKRIARHRHVPAVFKKAGEIKREELAAIRRREENRRKHEKKTVGKNPRRSERERMVLNTQE